MAPFGRSHQADSFRAEIWEQRWLKRPRCSTIAPSAPVEPRCKLHRPSLTGPVGTGGFVAALAEPIPRGSIRGAFMIGSLDNATSSAGAQPAR